jgi:hypothetical protein
MEILVSLQCAAAVHGRTEIMSQKWSFLRCLPLLVLPGALCWSIPGCSAAPFSNTSTAGHRAWPQSVRQYSTLGAASPTD